MLPEQVDLLMEELCEAELDDRMVVYDWIKSSLQMCDFVLVAFAPGSESEAEARQMLKDHLELAIKFASLAAADYQTESAYAPD